MAQRRFQIPGKLITSSLSGAVSAGNAGTKGIIVDDASPAIGNGIQETVTTLTTATSTQQITFHGWFYPTSTATGRYWLFMGNDLVGDHHWSFIQHVNNRLVMEFKNAAGTLIFQWITGDDAYTENAWNSILFSIDFANALTTWYVNDVAISSAPSVPSDSIPLASVADMILGFYAVSFSASGQFFGDASVLWCDFDRYVAFGTTANRRLFIDSSKRPVGLGVLGQIPFGSSPSFYFDGGAADYYINYGTLPNFQYVSGTSIGTNGFQDTSNNPATGTLA